jgi:hypothetical protein
MANPPLKEFSLSRLLHQPAEKSPMKIWMEFHVCKLSANKWNQAKIADKRLILKKLFLFHLFKRKGLQKNETAYNNVQLLNVWAIHGLAQIGTKGKSYWRRVDFRRNETPG